MILLRRLSAWLALALALATAPVEAAPRDWSAVAARLPSGAFVQGNPAAKVKLVEYLSLTCPHCALLESQAAVPLTARYIRTGLVSYEVRLALRDPFDTAAALLARCSGPRPFFAVKPALYAAQEQWIAKGSAWATTVPNMDGRSDGQVMQAVAAGAGLDAFFRAHGLPPARAAACLSDEAEAKRLATAAQAAWDIPGFPGTPTFLINGRQADGVASWTDLEVRIKAALGR